MWTIIFTIIIGGLALFFLFGLVWNFVICVAKLVLLIWYPIDWLIHRPRRYKPQRALD